jgi:predicted DNA-binding transcriptional regulator AlpA
LAVLMEEQLMALHNRKERRTFAAGGDEAVASLRESLPAHLQPALTTEQAAIYTGLAVATLEGLRSRGGGARFVRYGRKAVRYLVSDLDAWMAQRTVSSTSEAIAA